MPSLSVSSQIAFRLGASEAKELHSKDIDSEHLFLGLCKLEDILYIEKKAISDIDENQWQQALLDVKEFRDSLALASFDPKPARRRLRKILQESESTQEEFSGHRISPADVCLHSFPAIEKTSLHRCVRCIRCYGRARKGK